MEEVLHRTSVPSWMGDAVSELRWIRVLVDKPSRGGLTCEGDVKGGVGEEEKVVRVAADGVADYCGGGTIGGDRAVRPSQRAHAPLECAPRD